MKSLFTMAVLLLSCQQSLYAQSACEINGVHTNPNPAYVRPATGTGAPSHWTNHFDWTAPYWPIGWTTLPTNFDVPAPPPGANYKYIESPFYAPIPWMGYIAKEELSDFSPRDGWELVSRDFGMENTVLPTRRTGTFIEPHIFLYNKYTSTLRVLMPHVDDDDASYTVFRFILEPRSGQLASGLFAGAGGILNPLDQESPSRNIVSRVKALDLPYLWNHVEFPVYYDPCSCTQDQRLRTEFDALTVGEIRMYGLYAGTISTLNAATDNRSLPYPSSFQNPEAYLASLDGQDLSDIRPGSVVAKEMDALADNYERWVETLDNRNTGTLLAGIYDVVSLLGSASGLFGVHSVMGVDVEKVVKGLGIASKAYSKLFKPTNSDVDAEHYLPSYTQGEISLRGAFTQTTLLSGTTQVLALPGTPWTKNSSEVLPFQSATKPQYPLYNETLGLFAILHAPVVKRRVDQNYIPVVCPPNSGVPNAYYIGSWRQYQFDGSLDYVWNPAAHVDVENTRIHASLIVEQKNHQVVQGANVTETIVTNGERLYDSDVVNNVAQRSVFASDFVGLECLSELPMTLFRKAAYCDYFGMPPLPDYFSPNDTIYIRLVMDVRYKANEYGVRNRAMVAYTLPVEIVDVSDSLEGSGMPVYDDNIVVTSITHTSPYEVFAKSTITIDGEVRTNPTTHLASYVAGEEVVVQSGATLGMNTRLAIDYGTPCGKPRVGPYEGDIAAFCASSQYKANILRDNLRAESGTVSNEMPLENESRLYARLEVGTSAFDVVSERTDDPVVVVRVFDIVGNLQFTTYGTNSDLSTTRTEIDTTGLAAGAYIVVVSSGGRQASLKVLYTP